MGKPDAFLSVPRQSSVCRPISERVRDWREVVLPRPEKVSRAQASRCMDCGTPFCRWGCPAGNHIPEWNDLACRGRWQEAFALLRETNPFPEFTGRLCPAPCEHACVLGLVDDPVTVRENELAIVERAFELGLVVPRRIRRRSGLSVAVVGSGPAGLACADRLCGMGHRVVVYEADRKPGGLLRYGVPDFKLDKRVIDRRLAIMREEGVRFVTECAVPEKIPLASLTKEFDAVCLACGARQPRDLAVPGRDLTGICFAIDYLAQANRRVAGEQPQPDRAIDAAGKRVVVIGGGDTGADCVGTAHRQGAASVAQIEILPRPPERRTQQLPWPWYPFLVKVSTSHEEGCRRQWSVATKRFIGRHGRVTGLVCCRVRYARDSDGRTLMREIPGSSFEMPADLVVLALGFLPSAHAGDQFATSTPGVFVCGDCRRGPSLIVHAIADGREAAACIDEYLRAHARKEG